MSAALGRQHLVDVSNNSWGAIKPFSDDFGSAAFMQDYANIRYAVENGRGGLGTVVVFSAGNSRADGENVNHHNYQNARETITVAAVNQNDVVETFSTPGAAILTAAYGSGVLATDRLGGEGYNDYVDNDYTYSAALRPQHLRCQPLLPDAGSQRSARLSRCSRYRRPCQPHHRQRNLENQRCNRPRPRRSPIQR